MARARFRIREMTERRVRHVPPTSWSPTSTSSYEAGGRTTGGQLDGALARLDKYVEERMAPLLSKRHARRGRGHG